MPKQYGPPLGDLTWISDPYGDHKITDSRTGMEVVVVMKVWLDGLLASPASVRQEDLDSYSRVTEDLRHKLDREVAVSRELAVKLEQTEGQRNAMAKQFMDLHDLAKKFAPPKIRPPLMTPAASMRKAHDVAKNSVLNDLGGRPTFGEMLKAAETGEP